VEALPSAPAWICDAVMAAEQGPVGDLDEHTLAIELIERLPLERLVNVIESAIGRARDSGGVPRQVGEVTDDALARAAVTNMVAVLSNDDPGATTFVGLYAEACYALRDAGVPWTEGEHMLTLGERIRWLARQRPAFSRAKP